MTAVIFDMDGVLIDSEPLHFIVEKEIYGELGLSIGKEEHYALVGMTPLNIWQQLRKQYGLERPAQELKELEANRKVERFATMDIPLVPGVLGLLDKLIEANVPMALASSSPRGLIELFTQRTNTAGYFKYLLSGDQVVHGKPAPDIFLLAAQKLNTPPDHCNVIEDSHNGMLAALAAGMRCVGFQNPNSGKQDLRRAHLTIDEYSPENIAKFMSLTRASI